MKSRFAYPGQADSERARRWLRRLGVGLIALASYSSGVGDQALAMQSSGTRNGSDTRNSVPVAGANSPTASSNSLDEQKIVKSPREWRQQLSELEFYVTREKGTERAYSGKYWDHQESGIYTCKCCGNSLFASNAKFKSGTGWPSYYQPLSAQAVDNVADNSAGMARTEVTCRRCDAHLGHVFDDGPRPTGLRYCMNSAALGFKKTDRQPAKQNAAAEDGIDSAGFDSPQKLLEALSIAAAENSKDKFFKLICWAQTPDAIRSGLVESSRPVTSKKVKSMSLAPKSGGPPTGYAYNVNHEGNIRVVFEDGTTDSIWAYGKFKGRYFVAVPVPIGSVSSTKD